MSSKNADLAFSDQSSQVPQKSKVFFDISSLINHLRGSPNYSGIQRVVANIAAEFTSIYGIDGVYISYIDIKGIIRCASLADVGSETLRSPSRLRNALYGFGDSGSIDAVLHKYLGNKRKYLYHRTRLDLAARLGKTRLFRGKGMTPDSWKRARRTAQGQHLSLFDVTRDLSDCARPGDTMILLDASWSSEFTAPFVAARASGIELITLIYDLIPLKLPEAVDSALSITFSHYLLRTLEYTDRYLAISDYTRSDLLEFFDHLGVSQTVHTLRLSQTGLSSAQVATKCYELDGIDEILAAYPEAWGMQSVSPQVRAATYIPFVLCVGTIEPRKNVWRLAMAWRQLFDQGVPDLPRLVFAGRRGIMNEPFFDLMHGTGNLDGLVSIVDSPSDAELDYMYRRCQFFAMPSLAEGWGLPVGEGLAYGKTGIVSQTTSLPEVGEDLVQYCDPLSVTSIVEAAKALLLSPDLRQSLECRVRRAQLRNWADVAADLALYVSEGGKNAAAKR